MLTIGARNFLYPELHEPAWAAPRRQPQLNDLQSAAAYRAYFEGSLMRYRSSALLYAWQVENEPLGDDQIKAAQLAWEIDEAHQLDPGHKVVTTSFDAPSGWRPPRTRWRSFAAEPSQVAGPDCGSIGQVVPACIE